jgi:hypothetical protein
MTDNDYGFILTRHVNSENTNNYWNQCVKLLRVFYPKKKIIVIDDNSNYAFVKAEFDYANVHVIRSEFPQRGELLPYYYYLKHQFFSNAIILHDSVFFHRRINFEKFVKNGTRVLPLWCFHADTENVTNTMRIVRHLLNYPAIQGKLTMENTLLGLTHNNWYGCFGVQSYINLRFLKQIDAKYKIANLLAAVHCRADRCCLERIFGCIFCTESSKAVQQMSLLGNITSYHRWGYTYDEYIRDFKNGKVPKLVVKVWTGR